ncbi:MAG: peptidyl-prolyl cis-trans isomerase B (cyclophilin B) [Alcanivorax sp.]|jgi:peptidyl-prolyl cis-trans isomerase B (cyclophilin B)
MRGVQVSRISWNWTGLWLRSYLPVPQKAVSLVALQKSSQGITMVIIRTTFGELKLELDAEKAPKTVENFLKYAGEGYYDGTIFHRVIDNFMIQGGGFDTDMSEKQSGESIENEADNGLKNDFGTVAMARTMEPHSATAQFFINVKDNDFLNHSGKNMQGWGYTVFGKIIDGAEVLDKIRAVPTTSRGGHQDVPKDPVIIESVEVVDS